MQQHNNTNELQHASLFKEYNYLLLPKKDCLGWLIKDFHLISNQTRRDSQPNKKTHQETHLEAPPQDSTLSSPLSVGCIPAVVLVERLGWNTVEKLPGEDTEEGPRQV